MKLQSLYSEILSAKKGLRCTKVKGRKAILKERVSFSTVVVKHSFPKGTEVEALYEMTMTDLTVFKFPNGHNFQLRPHRYEWKDAE